MHHPLIPIWQWNFDFLRSTVLYCNIFYQKLIKFLSQLEYWLWVIFFFLISTEGCTFFDCNLVKYSSNKNWKLFLCWHLCCMFDIFASHLLCSSWILFFCEIFYYGKLVFILTVYILQTIRLQAAVVNIVATLQNRINIRLHTWIHIISPVTCINTYGRTRIYFLNE